MDFAEWDAKPILGGRQAGGGGHRKRHHPIKLRPHMMIPNPTQRSLKFKEIQTGLLLYEKVRPPNRLTIKGLE